MPDGKTSSFQVKGLLFNSWTYPYDIRAYVLTDGGVQFTSKFFAALCTMLDVKCLTTTAFHHQTNAQIEEYNCTIVTRRQHYVAKIQSDWNKYLQPPTYA